MVRKLTYLLGFGVVALCSLVHTTIWALQLGGMHLSPGAWATIPEMFGHPIPAMLRFTIPYYLSFVLCVALAALVLRRLWLMVRTRSLLPPSSYVGLLYYLMLVPITSLILAALVLIASMMLKAGSGVPAGLLAIPAVFLLPGGIAIMEALSLRSKHGNPNP